MVWKASATVILVVVCVAVLVQVTVTKTQIYKISRVNIGGNLGGALAIEGRVTYAVDNIFIVDDGTGKVEVSTCPTWYKRINLYPGDQVTVVGQVMNNPTLTTKTKFVLSAYKIFRGKEVLEVRGRPGKPPWMSYRTPEASPSP